MNVPVNMVQRTYLLYKALDIHCNVNTVNRIVSFHTQIIIVCIDNKRRYLSVMFFVANRYFSNSDIFATNRWLLLSLASILALIMKIRFRFLDGREKYSGAGCRRLRCRPTNFADHSQWTLRKRSEIFLKIIGWRSLKMRNWRIDLLSFWKLL